VYNDLADVLIFSFYITAPDKLELENDHKKYLTPVSVSTGPIHADTLSISKGGDCELTHYNNASNFKFTGTGFYHTQDPIRTYDISGRPPAAILSLLQSNAMLQQFEFAALGMPYALSSGMGEGALIPVSLADIAKMQNLTEAQRAQYFFVLFPEKSVIYFPNGTINYEESIRFNAYRFYNLFGENLTILLETKLREDGNGAQDQNALLDLIVSCCQNMNIMPIRLVGENGEAFLGLTLGLNAKLSNLFAHCKRYGLLCDVDGNNTRPQSSRIVEVDDDGNEIHNDYNGYWGYGASYDGYADDDETIWDPNFAPNDKDLIRSQNRYKQPKRDYQQLGYGQSALDMQHHSIMPYQSYRKANRPATNNNGSWDGSIDPSHYAGQAPNQWHSYQSYEGGAFNNSIDFNRQNNKGPHRRESNFDALLDENDIDPSHYAGQALNQWHSYQSYEGGANNEIDFVPQKPRTPIIVYQTSYEYNNNYIKYHHEYNAPVSPHNIIQKSNRQIISNNPCNMYSNPRSGMALVVSIENIPDLFKGIIKGSFIPLDFYELPKICVQKFEKHNADRYTIVNANISSGDGVRGAMEQGTDLRIVCLS
jgi:hypothetical protein